MVTSQVGRIARKSSQALRIRRREGSAELLRRLTRQLSTRLGADLPPLPLLADDVADSSTFVLPPQPAARPGGRLRINWISSPPSEGSGGHTTIFRFMQALEDAGHLCTLSVYDRYGGDIRTHERAVRSWWPQIKARVGEVGPELEPADAYVATSWPTAHVVARRATRPAHYFYLTQDFEPFFYPRGAEYALAEDTYRFGFNHLAVGRMVAARLRREVGVASTVAEFAADQSVYRLTNPRRRNEIAFYAKPDTPRRGFSLAVLALERFHRARPDVVIHSYGMRIPRLSFPVHQQLHIPPPALNELYNQCAAGLALSFTNVSLIAQELLASGAVPVVNDAADVRQDLSNRHVGWAAATPEAIAAALCRAVDGETATPAEIAASVETTSWSAAQHVVVAAIESKCFASDDDVFVGTA